MSVSHAPESDSLLPWTIVRGIFQARILEWVAIPSSRGSFQPRDWTWVSCIAGGFFTISATREAQKKHHLPPRKVIMKTPGKKSQIIGFGVSKVKVQTWNEKLWKNMKPNRTIVPYHISFPSPLPITTPYTHTHTHTCLPGTDWSCQAGAQGAETEGLCP